MPDKIHLHLCVSQIFLKLLLVFIDNNRKQRQVSTTFSEMILLATWLTKLQQKIFHVMSFVIL